MIWLVTIPSAIIAAYSTLCILINRDMRSGGGAVYWVLLAASATVIYVAWFHPVGITIT
jgi:hypothetical protein